MKPHVVTPEDAKRAAEASGRDMEKLARNVLGWTVLALMAESAVVGALGIAVLVRSLRK